MRRFHIMHHGHAFVEIDMGDVRVMIDPFITGNRLCRISYDEVVARRPAYIVVTHGHSDHLGDALALSRDTGATIIATFGLISTLQQFHDGPWIPMHMGGTYHDEYYHFSVRMTVALHGGTIHHNDTIVGYDAPVGVIVFGEHVSIYHAGDTALTYDMQLLERYAIDVALLPIGGRYTMDREDAVRAVEMIRPRIVVPIHYNTFPAIRTDTTLFARDLLQQNIAVPKVLTSGQYVVLDDTAE